MTETSKGNHPPIFDVSSASVRINLWLNASHDLSKEGLVENPDSPLDPTLRWCSNQIGDPSYRSGDDSLQRTVSPRTPGHIYMSPLGSAGNHSADKPLLGKTKEIVMIFIYQHSNQFMLIQY